MVGGERCSDDALLRIEPAKRDLLRRLQEGGVLRVRQHDVSGFYGSLLHVPRRLRGGARPLRSRSGGGASSSLNSSSGIETLQHDEDAFGNLRYSVRPGITHGQITFI